MQKVSLIFIMLVLLAGCQTKRVLQEELHKVELGNGLFFNLLAPASFGRSITFTQIAEIQTKQATHELIFVVEILPTEMTIVGLLPSGTRVFSASYDGIKITSEGYSQLIEKLDPKYLMADVQLSLWPHDVLMSDWFSQQACYKVNQCQFLQTPNYEQRNIVLQGRELITIQYSAAATSPKTIRLNNRLRGYRIFLESVD